MKTKINNDISTRYNEGTQETDVILNNSTSFYNSVSNKLIIYAIILLALLATSSLFA